MVAGGGWWRGPCSDRVVFLPLLCLVKRQSIPDVQIGDSPLQEPPAPTAASQEGLRWALRLFGSRMGGGVGAGERSFSENVSIHPGQEMTAGEMGIGHGQLCCR